MPIAELVLVGLELAKLGLQISEAAQAGNEAEATAYLTKVRERVRSAESAWEASK